MMLEDKYIKWLKYAVYDKKGHPTGVKDNAPEEAKKSYQAYLNISKEMEKQGLF